MQEPASVMNTGPQETDMGGTVDGGDGRRRGPIKFAYTTGARPLDGYTIKRGIGAGGFGDVYYATSDAGKDVALKRIQRNLDVELRGVSQCLNLKHHNLVALYDIRYDGEQQAWVVMEYVAGENLQDVIERNPNGMPHDQVLLWLEGVVNGVAYLHDHGIVHRDLKPGNIFLDHHTVKIGDYGLSKFISCSRRSGQTESVGTFHYMAPEIGLGKYGKEIDVYALGILLYEMLTGRVPFEGESSQEIIMKHLTTQPDVSRLPTAYRTTVSRAMAKDPAERFKSARELLASLQGSESSNPATMTGQDDRTRRASVTVPPPIHTAQAATLRAVRTAQEKASQAEEPIAAGIRAQIHHLRDRWQTLRPMQRLVVGMVLPIVLLFNFSWLFPLAFLGMVVYCGYYLLWYVFFRPTSPAPHPVGRGYPVGLKETTASPKLWDVSDPAITAAVREQSPRPAHVSSQQLTDAMRQAIQNKTLAQRGSELTGSMLMAAFVGCVLSVFVAMFYPGDGTTPTSGGWAPGFIWLACTSVFAAWTVLLLGKVWEAREGDQAIRRFYTMVTGMLVGGVAFLLYQSLLLSPVYPLMTWNNSILTEVAPELQLYSDRGEPHPAAFAGYFGLVFVLIRWWTAADPLRSSRFSASGTIATIVIALLANGVLPIPRGFLVVITTIVSVQLSATWVDSRRRRDFRDRLATENS